MLKIYKLGFILLYSSIINFVLISQSYAYLDPGTGSIILQMLAAIIAGILAFSQYLKIKIKKIFSNFFKSKNNNNKKNY